MVVARTLIMFGLAAGHAKRFSLILWAVVTLPLIVIGFVALAFTGIQISRLNKEATAATFLPRNHPHRAALSRIPIIRP